MKPLVSVIMAAYNAEKTIGTAIRSILGQTFSEWELIIVDDASRDCTIKVVQAFSDNRIILKRNKENLKQGMSRNIAIELAKGDFIAVQDADDVSMPERLEKQVNYLMNHKEVDVIGSNAYLFDKKGVIIGAIVKKGKTHQELTARINSEIPLIHASIMGKAEWFKKYRYRNFTRSEDRDLFYRSYRKSIFVNLNEYLYAIFDPRKLSLKKLIKATETNLIMRLKHWQEYGLPIKSVVTYPFLVAGKWLYWGLLALQGKSIFDFHKRDIPKDQKFYRDQYWILHCLKGNP